MNPDEVLGVYLGLVEHHELAGITRERDRFLMLAIDSARTADRQEMASSLWQRLVQFSPQHVMARYRDLAEPFRSPDIQAYLRELRLEYPVSLASDQLAKIRSEKPAESTISIRPVVNLWNHPSQGAETSQTMAQTLARSQIPPGKALAEPLPWRRPEVDPEAVDAFSRYYCQGLSFLLVFSFIGLFIYAIWGQG